MGEEELYHCNICGGVFSFRYFNHKPTPDREGADNECVDCEGRREQQADLDRERSLGIA